MNTIYSRNSSWLLIKSSSHTPHNRRIARNKIQEEKEKNVSMQILYCYSAGHELLCVVVVSLKYGFCHRHPRHSLSVVAGESWIIPVFSRVWKCSPPCALAYSNTVCVRYTLLLLLLFLWHLFANKTVMNIISVTINRSHLVVYQMKINMLYWR